MNLKEYIEKLETKRNKTYKAWQNTWAGSEYEQQLWGQIEILDRIIGDLKALEEAK